MEREGEEVVHTDSEQERMMKRANRTSEDGERFSSVELWPELRQQMLHKGDGMIWKMVSTLDNCCSECWGEEPNKRTATSASK